MSSTTLASSPASSRVFLVTGGNSGIGLGAALALATRDKSATIVIASRTSKKNEEACASIIAESGNSNVFPLKLDLDSLEATKDFSERFTASYPRLDGLILNAGILINNDTPKTTDGYEITFQTNHLSHFLLINLMTPLLNKTAALGSTPKIISTSSFTINPKGMFSHLMAVPTITTTMAPAVFAKTNGLAYTTSKLLNAITSFHLSQHLQQLGMSTKVQVAAYDPGFVRTEINRSGSWMERVSVASILPHLAKMVGWNKVSTIERSGGFIAELALKSDDINGKWYSVDQEEEWASPKAIDPVLGASVWQESLDLVKSFL